MFRFEREKKTSVPLEREVVKTIECPHFMNYELVERWGDGIPRYEEADPKHPEWRATPVIPINLSQEGYGEVFVKNEADPKSNRTKTIKDRAAWELATLYRDYARDFYIDIKKGILTKDKLKEFIIPRFSLITAGNEGVAIAECFKKYDLPAPKIILDKDVKKSYLEELKKLRTDIYLVDLSEKEFTAEDIKRLSNNEKGSDITSIRFIKPESIFYDWHVHEAFNEKPDEIYVPYGSGRLMENYLYWQFENRRKGPDPRLKIDLDKLRTISILGAEPEKKDSIADKLTAAFKPFLLFKDKDIGDIKNFRFTGENTNKYLVKEKYIKEAHGTMIKNNIEAEPSAAAGLALYLERHDKGLIQEGKKALIINTGKGLDLPEKSKV